MNLSRAAIISMLAMVVIGCVPLQSKSQVSLRLADSLALHFPSKPLERDSFAPAMVFLDDYLMVFPGDFSANILQRTDTGYVFRSNLKFWREEKGKLRFDQSFRYFLLGGSLWGLGQYRLLEYELPAPTSYSKNTTIIPKDGTYISLNALEPVISKQVSANTYQLFIATNARTRVNTLHPNAKQREDWHRAPRFEIFLLTLDEKGTKVKWRKSCAQGIRNDADFVNFHSNGLRSPTLAACGDGICLSFPTSNWIWQFDFEGNLRDSIYAKAAMMPDSFVQAPYALKRAAIRSAEDSTSYFGKLLSIDSGKKLVRMYWLPIGEDHHRLVYLQVIDPHAKTVQEIELDSKAHYRWVCRDRLVEVTDWDISKGFVKIRLFDIHLE